MSKAIAINGSPKMRKGHTWMILEPFLEGMSEEGWEVDTIQVGRIKVRPCTGQMRCWYAEPGRCHIRDDMQDLYPRIACADLLVLATPVYIPLPGGMQDFINRLCPLMEPRLETRDGRTRARFRDHVRIRGVLLVSTGGWWELGNFDTVVRIAKEFALAAGVEFTGTVLRPHAWLMKRDDELTPEGQAVVEASRQAGRELASAGAMQSSTLEAVSRPLISQEKLRRHYNALLSRRQRNP